MSCSLRCAVFVATLAATSNPSIGIEARRSRRRLKTDGDLFQKVDPHHHKEKWLLGRTSTRRSRTRPRSRSDTSASSSSNESTKSSTESKNDGTSSTNNDGSSATSTSDSIQNDTNTEEIIECSDASEVPTSMPAAEPTVATMAPVSVATSECSLVPGTGNFRNTIGERRDITFHYEVETIPNIASGIFNDNLISVVEGAIADRLLTLFFQDCRETSRALHRGIRRAEVCEASGYSSFPIDRVLVGAECVGEYVDPLNNCFVVDGGVAIYFEKASDCPDAVNRSKTELKTAMANGSFDQLDDRIVKVKYIENFNLDANTDVNAVEGSDTVSDESSQLPSYAWALVALGGILFVLIIALIVKYYRLVKKDIELNNLELESDFEYDSVSVDDSESLEEYVV